MKCDLEKFKEENHNLKNNLGYKRDVIEDMETELDKLERITLNDKKKLELKDKDFHRLEMLIFEQVEEINILRDNNLSMVSQISENMRMEKLISIQNKVIKDLEDRLKDAEKVDITLEVDKLLLEIENLQQENEVKVKLLQNIEKENQILKDNLKTEQDEKDALLGNKERVSDNLSLVEELSLVSQIPSLFPCESCGKGFVTRDDLKLHSEVDHGKQHRLNKLNEKFVSLETKVLQQKFIFMSKLLKLKEKEAVKKYVCKCNGVCRINHRIYNWNKPRSETISTKSKDIFEKKAVVDKEIEASRSQCKNCDNIFDNSEELKTHSVTLHCIKTCLVNPWGLQFVH